MRKTTEDNLIFFMAVILLVLVAILVLLGLLYLEAAGQPVVVIPQVVPQMVAPAALFC